MTMFGRLYVARKVSHSAIAFAIGAGAGSLSGWIARQVIGLSGSIAVLVAIVVCLAVLRVLSQVLYRKPNEDE
jgi:hypothetical protein